MYHKGDNTIQSVTNLKTYKLPFTPEEQDIGRRVEIKNGKLVIESVKAKNARLRELFFIELEENRPILNVSNDGEFIEPKLFDEPEDHWDTDKEDMH